MEKLTTERLLKFDSKRILLFITFLLAFIITKIGRKVYRPYIYSNDISISGLPILLETLQEQ